MFTHKVDKEEAAAFSRFLGIPLASAEVLDGTDRPSYLTACGGCCSVFLDPDTGVRISQTNRTPSPQRFLFGEEVVKIAKQRPKRGLVLTFDQSLALGREEDEIKKKLAHFKRQGVAGFAYVSHASFMVLGRSRDVVSEAKAKLISKSGLPQHRLVEQAARRA